MKTLLICVSVHHQNTAKVAAAMAEAIQADIRKPEDIRFEDLSAYDIIGFGSGIYMWKHHKSLLDFAAKLPGMGGKPVFIFSTSGGKKGLGSHGSLKAILGSKDCRIIGEFNCLGWDSFGPFKLVGGMNKGKPDDESLERAREFARSLKI